MSTTGLSKIWHITNSLIMSINFLIKRYNTYILVTKIFAINNHLANNWKQMQRVRLSKAQLYPFVSLLTASIIAFIVVWT